MPIQDMDPGTSPEAPGTWYFYKQGSATSTGVSMTTEGNITAAGTITGATVSPTTLALTGALATTDVITEDVTGDTFDRFRQQADGTMNWGPGNASRDTNLYRSAANTLTTDDALTVGNGLTVTGLSTLVERALTTNNAYRARVTGDANSRYLVNADGSMLWGDGTASGDTKLYRSAANTLTTDDDFAVAVAGKGLKIAEGANAKMGTATLVAGASTVSTTAVTANSRIFLTSQVDGGTPGFLRVSARVAATSFTITSSSGTDTSTVAWMIVEPA